MDITDMILLGLSNLRRTRLRTFLTTLGVIIGIGALTSMVSFGTGMQKNVTDAIMNNDLFTSITVTSQKTNIKEIASGDVEKIAGTFSKKGVPLTDSLLQAIRNLEGVEMAYPNMDFSARLHFANDSASISVQALPAALKKYKPFNQLVAGSFFDSDSCRCIVLREETLKKLKIKLIKDRGEDHLTRQDSARGFVLMHPDSIIGKTIEIVTVSMNPKKMSGALLGMIRNQPEMPFDETVTRLKITGILTRAGQFGGNVFSGGAIIPPGTAAEIPRLSFSSVWDILNSKNKKGTYGSIHVRLTDMGKMDKVKASLDAMGVGVFTIADQLEAIKRGFLIFDSILGAIGVIALIVAALGIVNTMVMSILERTREIGIMKAIGGSEKEIKMIFFTEAAVIGFIGAVFGLVLGWLVTRAANLVLNAQITPKGVDPVNLFYFPWWLILGAVLFSIVVSLVAAVYPAARAARIDPVKALRHD